MTNTTASYDDATAVAVRARQELAQEMFHEAVEAEKARLRAINNRSLFRRLIDAIPFTITWKSK